MVISFGICNISLSSSTKSNFKVHVIKGKFHDIVDNALSNLEKDGKILAPTFVFIDPFGFSGIPATIIEKFLRIPKGSPAVSLTSSVLKNKFKYQIILSAGKVLSS